VLLRWRCRNYFAGVQQVKLYDQYRSWLHDAKQEHSDALQHERSVHESLKSDLKRCEEHAHDLQSELESKKYLNGDLSRQMAELATRLDKRRAQEDALKV
jgi:chromosome segregation ATPase